MANKRLFLVSNSHIDPVWLWDKYEGIDEIINTFRSACERLDEYPDLRFSASSISFYKWVEHYSPDVFERIKAHVAIGRWEIVGGWLVEADCNLPTADSFRKSAEISLAYAKDRFGVDVPVAYSPDSFGHPATLPTLLAESGFKYYVFSRPQESEKPDLPSNLFWWEHEGSRVLCYRLKYHYTQGRDMDFDSLRERIGDESMYINNLACFFFGVGDHGGGPTKREIEFYKAETLSRPQLGMQFATCLDFFKEAEKLPDIPTYSGDLHMHAIGCYSVNRAIKHAVRTAERALTYTQRVIDDAPIPPLPRAGEALPASSPSEAGCERGRGEGSLLDPLWETTIFNEFHDILPGSCSPDAAKQCLDDLGGVNSEALNTSYEALKRISGSQAVTRKEGEFRLYNSLPYPVTGPFQIESFQYYRDGAPFRDISGKELPIQEVTASVKCGNRRWLFVDTIPAKTMKSYYFDTDAEPKFGFGDAHFFKPGESAAQDILKVDAPGQIAGAASGKAFFKTPLVFSVMPDDSDTWSHGLAGYGEGTGWFEQEMSAVVVGKLASFLVSKQKFRDSSLELTFAVYKGMPFADLRIKVYWQEPRSILKMELAPAERLDMFIAQGPGGAIEKRTNRREEPLHGWIQAGNLAILQDGAFAMDRFDERLRFTLIRSSIFGFHDPWKIDELGPLEHTDLGLHEFRFRFLTQPGISSDELDRLLATFIEPFKVVRENS